MNLLRVLWALVQKNIVLKKTSWFLTLCQLTAPIFFAWVWTYRHFLVPPETTHETPRDPEWFKHTTVWPFQLVSTTHTGASTESLTFFYQQFCSHVRREAGATTLQRNWYGEEKTVGNNDNNDNNDNIDNIDNNDNALSRMGPEMNQISGEWRCPYRIALVGVPEVFVDNLFSLYHHSAPDPTDPKLLTRDNFVLFPTYDAFQDATMRFGMGLQWAVLIHFKKFGLLEHHDDVTHLDNDNNVDPTEVQPTYEYAFYLRRYYHTAAFEVDRSTTFFEEGPGSEHHLYIGPRFALHNLIQQTILRTEGLFNTTDGNINIQSHDDVGANQNNNNQNNNNNNQNNNNDHQNNNNSNNNHISFTPTINNNTIAATKTAVYFNFTSMPTPADNTVIFDRHDFRWLAASWSFFMWVVPSATFALHWLSERESPIYSTMLVSGGTKALLVASHFITSLLVNIPNILLSSSLLYYKFFYQTDATFIQFTLLFWAYLLASLSATFFLTSCCVAQNSVAKQTRGSTVMFISIALFALLTFLTLLSDYIPRDSPWLVVSSMVNCQLTFVEATYGFIDNDINGQWSFLWLCAFQTAFYITLGVYADNVLHTKGMKWYYPLTTKYWRELWGGLCVVIKRKKKVNYIDTGYNNNNNNDNIDENTNNLHLLDGHEQSIAATEHHHSQYGAQCDDMPQSMYIEPLSLKDQQNLAVRIRGLTKTFKGRNDPVLRGVNLDVARGQSVALLGRNSAGKSTMLSIIAGTLHPTAGDITFFDREHNPSNDPWGFVGVCPQSNAFWPGLTVKQTLETFGTLKEFAMALDLSSHQRDEEVMRVLKLLKLDAFLNHNVKSLTFAQQRLLGLCVALLHSPDLLLLDEIAQGCDLHQQRLIVEVLKREQQRGLAIISTTHIMTEAQASDRCAILTYGTLSIQGSTAFLNQKCGTGYVLTLEKARGGGGGKVGMVQHEQNEEESNNQDLFLSQSLHASQNNNNNNNNSKGLDQLVINSQRGVDITTQSGQMIVDVITLNMGELADVLALQIDSTNAIKFNIPFNYSEYMPTVLSYLEAIQAQRPDLIETIRLSVAELGDLFLLANHPSFLSRINPYATTPTSTDGTSSQHLGDTLNDPTRQQQNRVQHLKTSVESEETEVVITTDIWRGDYSTALPPHKLWWVQFIALCKRHVSIRLSQPLLFVMRVVVPIVCLLLLLRASLRWFGEFNIRTTLEQFPKTSPAYYSVLGMQGNVGQSGNNLNNNPNNNFNNNHDAINYDTTIANDLARDFFTPHLTAIPYDITSDYKWYETNPWELQQHQQQQGGKQGEQRPIHKNNNSNNNNNNNNICTTHTFLSHNPLQITIDPQHINVVPGYFMNHTAELANITTINRGATLATRSYLGINVYNASYTPQNNGVQAIGTVYTNTYSLFSDIAALTRLYENLSQHFTLNTAQKHSFQQQDQQEQGDTSRTHSITTNSTIQQYKQAQTVQNKLKIISSEGGLPSQRHFRTGNENMWIAVLISLWLFPQSIAASLVAERETQFFHLLRLSNLKLSAYWMSHFVCDAAEWFLLSAVLIAPRLLNLGPQLAIDLPLATIVLGGLTLILQCYVLSLFFATTKRAQFWYNVCFILAFFYNYNVLGVRWYAHFFSRHTTASGFAQLAMSIFSPTALVYALAGQEPDVFTRKPEQPADMPLWGKIEPLWSFYPLWWAVGLLIVYPLILATFHYLEDHHWFTVATTPQPIITKALHVVFCCWYDRRYRDGEVYSITQDKNDIKDDLGDHKSINDGGAAGGGDDVMFHKDPDVLAMEARIRGIDWAKQNNVNASAEKAHSSDGSHNQHLLSEDEPYDDLNNNNIYHLGGENNNIVGKNDNHNGQSTVSHQHIPPIVAHGLRKVYPVSRRQRKKYEQMLNNYNKNNHTQNNNNRNNNHHHQPPPPPPGVALDNIYLECHKDQITLLLSPDGGGKTSLLEMLACAQNSSRSTQQLQQQKHHQQQQNNTQHTAYINGFNINHANRSAAIYNNPNNIIGYAPQGDASLIDTYTPREMFYFYCHMRGVVGRRADYFVHDLLHSLNLTAAADRKINKCTPGIRRRVTVGVALCGAPSIVLLDEPGTQTDTISRRALQLFLQHTAIGRTVLLTTNLLDDVEMADQVVLMDKGKLVAAGTPTALRKKLGDGFVVNVTTLSNVELVVLIHVLTHFVTDVVVPEELETILKIYKEQYAQQQQEETQQQESLLLSQNNNNTFIKDNHINCDYHLDPIGGNNSNNNSNNNNINNNSRGEDNNKDNYNNDKNNNKTISPQDLLFNTMSSVWDDFIDIGSDGEERDHNNNYGSTNPHHKIIQKEEEQYTIADLLQLHKNNNNQNNNNTFIITQEMIQSTTTYQNFIQQCAHKGHVVITTQGLQCFELSISPDVLNMAQIFQVLDHVKKNVVCDGSFLAFSVSQMSLEQVYLQMLKNHHISCSSSSSSP